MRIDRFARSNPSELSGGEQQRVAIARAIIAHPRLLLLDEPMSSLDAELKNDLMAELKSLQSALDATVIYITHDRVEALTRFADASALKPFTRASGSTRK